MFVQQLSIRARPEAIPQLRRLVQSQYLPHMRQCPGFINGYLIAHIDHQDSAELIIYWKNEQAMRFANAQTDKHYNIPYVADLQVKHQSYMMSQA